MEVSRFDNSLEKIERVGVKVGRTVCGAGMIYGLAEVGWGLAEYLPGINNEQSLSLMHYGTTTFLTGASMLAIFEASHMLFKGLRNLTNRHLDN